MKDQKLDALLRGWEVQPPPSLVGQGDGAWDERAASIVQNAVETARAHAPLDEGQRRLVAHGRLGELGVLGGDQPECAARLEDEAKRGAVG